MSNLQLVIVMFSVVFILGALPGAIARLTGNDHGDA